MKAALGCYVRLGLIAKLLENSKVVGGSEFIFQLSQENLQKAKLSIYSLHNV